MKSSRTGKPAQAPDVDPGQAALSPDKIRQALEKVLTSHAFETASAQRNFLRYTVEQTLEGKHEFKELLLAVEVFGRDESFDPRRSSIVRTEAQKLRSRLARYYETEGREDLVRIDFPKGGYSPVFRMEAGVKAESPAPHPPKAPLPLAPVRPRWLAWALSAALILAAVLVAFSLRDGALAKATDSAPSIAVLPFLNLSSGNTDSVLSDGLTGEVVDSLARVPHLRVVARAAVLKYRALNVDVRKIGRDLNVERVFEGSVRQQGSRVRITAELSDTASGYQVWAGSYDRDVKDSLAIQREISEAIKKSLGVLLSANAVANSGPDAGDEAAAHNP